MYNTQARSDFWDIHIYIYIYIYLHVCVILFNLMDSSIPHSGPYLSTVLVVQRFMYICELPQVFLKEKHFFTLLKKIVLPMQSYVLVYVQLMNCGTVSTQPLKWIEWTTCRRHYWGYLIIEDHFFSEPFIFLTTCTYISSK